MLVLTDIVNSWICQGIVFSEIEVVNIEDLIAKVIDIKLMSAKSFSFAAKYALPHREIVIGASYPLIGCKKIAMEWSAEAERTWDNMDDGMDKSADSNRAYITEKNGKLIWIFEING